MAGACLLGEDVGLVLGEGCVEGGGGAEALGPERAQFAAPIGFGVHGLALGAEPEFLVEGLAVPKPKSVRARAVSGATLGAGIRPWGRIHWGGRQV